MRAVVSLMLLLSIFATSTVLSRDGSFNEQFCSVTLSSCYLSVIKSNSQDRPNVDNIKKGYNSCEDEYARCTKRAAVKLCTKNFPRQCERAQDCRDKLDNCLNVANQLATNQAKINKKRCYDRNDDYLSHISEESCGSDNQISLCENLYEDLYSVPDKCTVSFNACLFKDNHKADADSVLNACVKKIMKCHDKQIQKTCSAYDDCDPSDPDNINCNIMHFMCQKDIPH